MVTESLAMTVATGGNCLSLSALVIGAVEGRSIAMALFLFFLLLLLLLFRLFFFFPGNNKMIYLFMIFTLLHLIIY